ncbi:MAG: hypothetical protein JWQ89_2626, partial [Devosia sp.]|nr:hypothetical protein [Devosia sp.]
HQRPGNRGDQAVITLIIGLAVGYIAGAYFKAQPWELWAKWRSGK